MLLAAVAALFLAEFLASPAQINSPARLGDGAWWAAAPAEREWRKAGPGAGGSRTAGMEGGGEEDAGQAQGNEGQREQEQQQEQFNQHQGEWPQQTEQQQQQQAAWNAGDEAKARENKERGEEAAAVSEESSDGSSSGAERVGAAPPQPSQAQLSPQQQRAYRDEMKRAAARGERYYLVWSPTWDRRQPVMLIEHFEARFGPWHTVPPLYFDMGPRTGELAKHKDAFLVVRVPQEEQFGYMVCYKKTNQDVVTPDPDFLRPIDPHVKIASTMANAMGGPQQFDFVHVRRGDKVNPKMWPHLDRDTRPKALLQKLPERIPPGSTLYIATNERDTHFFDPLLAVYKLYKEEYFAQLWAEGSVWEREMRVVAAGVGVEGRVEADSEVLVLVDYQLKALARNALETFNDLTDDPRDGVLAAGGKS
ncbi:unnamed protein product [Closterium sp. Naga37s-1]|nr:unnamed protein product [Closterium sp. Naga37s-1]